MNVCFVLQHWIAVLAQNDYIYFFTLTGLLRLQPSQGTTSAKLLSGVWLLSVVPIRRVHSRDREPLLVETTLFLS